MDDDILIFVSESAPHKCTCGGTIKFVGKNGERILVECNKCHCRASAKTYKDAIKYCQERKDSGEYLRHGYPIPE